MRAKSSPPVDAGFLFSPISDGQSLISHSFSLLELLVVVAVMTVLFAALMPALGAARSFSYRTACSSNLRQIGLAFDMYRLDFGDVYPAADDAAAADEGWPWLWMGRGWRPVLAPYIAGHIDRDHPSVLACPRDPTDPGTYENTSYGYAMSFYHSPDQIDRMTDKSACYANPQPAVPVQSDDVAHPARKILAGEWASHHTHPQLPDGWWSWAGARNVLCADAHVIFMPATDMNPANDGLPDPNLTVHGVRGADF